MKNKRRIVGLVAAMLLAVVGTLSLVAYVRSAKDKAVAQEELVDVYVVDTFVPKGADPETIRSAVEIEQVPARLKQAGAVTDLDTIGDQVAASDFQPGDQLLAARLGLEKEVSDEVTDKVQVSTLLEAQRAVGGAIQKGDLVGVYVSFDPFDADEAGQDSQTQSAIEPTAVDAFGTATAESAPTDESTGVDPAALSKTPNVSRLEFRNVLVTNVQTTSAPVTTDAEDDDETAIAQVSGTQYVVTLALSPEQSERFVFATEFGRVWLSLDPAGVGDDGTRAVTLGNMFQVVQ
jgi:pilus assembly protein CpaB